MTGPTARRAATDALLLAVFALSGFAGLAYELLWIRDFSFLLGSTVQTLSAVLAAYMAGLAAGSWASGRWADRATAPLVVYAALEAGIAVSALGLDLLFHGVLSRLGAVSAGQEGAGVALLARFALTLVLLFVPTACMGATFPLLARRLAGNARNRGLRVGVLYGANALGAAAGCLLTGFLLIPRAGTIHTTWLAAALNLSAAVLALVAHRVSRERPAPLHPAPAPDSGLHGDARFLTAGMFASGALCMAYEILYSRFLGYIVGNRVHAATIMLAVFLAGIPIGSLIGGRFADRLRREPLWFSLLQLSTGLHAAVVVLWFPEILSWMRLAVDLAGPTTAWGAAMLRMGEAAVLLLPPALAAGALYPVAIHGIARAGGSVARASSRIYAANTLGCVLGSLLTGLVAIPLMGAWAALLTASLASILLGFRWLAPDASGPAPRRMVSAAAVAGCALLVLTLAARDHRYPWDRAGLELVFAEEEPAGLVTAWKDGRGGYALFADNTEISYPIGSYTASSEVETLQAHLPLLLHPAPHRVLVIGLGFGITSGAFATSSRIDSVETVEYLAGVIRAAPQFRTFNYDVTRNPKSVLIAGDGRHYLARARDAYDIITSNVTGPEMPGSAVCYTREYFELARRALRPGGLLVVHAFGRDRAITFHTLAVVFPHVLGFRSFHEGVFLVASMTPVPLDPASIDARLAADPGVRRWAERSTLTSGAGVRERMVLTEPDFLALAGAPGLPVNSDITPVVEYGLPSDGQAIFSSSFSPARSAASDRVAVVTVASASALRRVAHRRDLHGIVVATLGGNLVEWNSAPAADRATDALARRGVRVVSLAGANAGGPALRRAGHALHLRGLHAIGSGANAERARLPAVVAEDGLRIAFLSYDLTGPSGRWATRRAPGTTHADLRGIRADIRDALGSADAVVVLLHGAASEHDSRAVIEAGALIVLGDARDRPARSVHYRNGMILTGPRRPARITLNRRGVLHTTL